MSINDSSTSNRTAYYNNEMNYNTPSISRPSVFQSSHAQPPFTMIVTNPSTSYPSPGPSFTPLNVPQNGSPWKCPEWMSQGSQSGFLEFSSPQSRMPFKRKAADEIKTSIQNKQLITEEKMAAHLNGLHISNDYTSHATNSNSSNDWSDALKDIEECRFDPILTTTQDLEEKLRRAQRITIYDEVRKLQDEPILPQSILNRYDAPCSALVLWQPPAKITDLIIPKDSKQRQDEEDAEQDNNNSELIDLNNENGTSMELDI